MHAHNVKAFSLIELMVVIAIVAILSAIAVPYYGDYIVRTKLSNGMIMLEHLKKKAMEYYSLNGTFPTLAQIGAVNTDFATNILDWGDMGPTGWDGGNAAVPYVEVEYASDVVPGQTAPRLAFVATVSGSSITWDCYTNHVADADNSISSSFLPQVCSVHP